MSKELIVVAVLLTIVLTVYVVDYAKKHGAKATLKAAQTYAANIIMAVGIKLVTDAERQYGAGTGQLKMASAVAELIKLLPEWVAEAVSKVWLQERLEGALKDAKEKWQNNPNLLRESQNKPE